MATNGSPRNMPPLDVHAVPPQARNEAVGRLTKPVPRTVNPTIGFPLPSRMREAEPTPVSPSLPNDLSQDVPVQRATPTSASVALTASFQATTGRPEGSRRTSGLAANA